MNLATKEFLSDIDALADKRKREIIESRDELVVSGQRYFVSSDGDDENDGLSPQSAWKTLRRVSDSRLSYGDAVLFRRGDIFRGFVKTQDGVSYGAYGDGDKPKLFGGEKNLSKRGLWELYDAEKNIWRLREKILDCGTLVFNGGEAHSRKLIPSYIGCRFVCRENPKLPFDVSIHMTRDLDIFCHYDERLTAGGSGAPSFPIPMIDDECYGTLYLRCDAGDPAEVFSDIEALPHRSMFQVGDCRDVTIDNLCLKYIGIHAVAAGGHVEGLRVSNCEIGWIGGCVQHYFGTDPNNPDCCRGSVTRYGNGVEIYGGCERYTVENCYIYQCYDAGITHQMNTGKSFYRMEKIKYSGNLIENCVYSIEYFLDKPKENESYIKECEIKDNILRLSGYGWGQQRPNIDTPAHIKSWNHDNEASDFVLRGNIFDRSAYRLLHLVAREQDSCPTLEGNTYIQTLGGTLGQLGGCECGEPQMQIFDECAENFIRNTLGDENAKIYYLQ